MVNTGDEQNSTLLSCRIVSVLKTQALNSEASMSTSL